MKSKSKSQVIKPDSKSNKVENGVTIFTAGSIEMGNAILWADILIDEFKDYPITFFNPRRDFWDKDLPNKESNSTFNYQVNWELDNLDISDIIFMYFDPKTISPISLLEFGRYSESGKIIVVCPDGYFRKGNVEIVCSRYNIPLYNDLDSGMGALKTKLNILFRT